MLKGLPQVFYLGFQGFCPAGAMILSLALLSACNQNPVLGKQITTAPEIRHAQYFETELLSAVGEQCVVRTKLPNQRLPGTWVDERNSAVRAALDEARRCCSEPRLLEVADWMVGFTAYEVRFDCSEQ